MKAKNERRLVARNIRRATGISLPLAALAAKLVVAGFTFELTYEDKLREFLEMHDTFGCGPECCGYNWKVTAFKGPKGTLAIDDIRKPLVRKASSPMPAPIRFLWVRIENVDSALAALRTVGAAMIVDGKPLNQAGRIGWSQEVPMIRLAINFSGNKAHKALVLAGVVPASSSRDIRYMKKMCG